VIDLILRSCAICGLTSYPIRFLCPDCLHKLRTKWVKPQVFYQENLTIHYLTEWNSQNGLLMSDLLTKLKGKRSKRAWEEIAEWYLQYFVTSLPSNAIIVPLPSSNNAKAHHAQHFAKSLSKRLRVPVVEPLMRQDKGSQKKRSKQQRRQIKMSLKPDIFIPEGAQIVLVDDLVTTGSSILAASKVLGKRRILAAWTFACRRQERLL
jgi:predicted amidophosphoribosyltransferase